MTKEESRKLKTENWKKSVNATRERRKSQTCKVFSLKLDKDKLSGAKLHYLNGLFTEAKWVYNHILASPDVFKFDSKITEVNTLDKEDNIIVKKLENISSQMKQSIFKRIKTSVLSLSKKKKNKSKVGRLKFKSRVDSIPLEQFDVTYKFKDNFLKLQGNYYMKFKLLGMHQLPADADFANAILTRRNGDFYLKVTCFVETKKQTLFANEIIGIDAGCSTALTLSDGTKYNVSFPVSKQTKKLQRKLKHKPSHKKKGRKSNNCWKLYEKINASKDKTTRQKKDKINKIVSEITKKHKIICIQDENVKGWKSQHGKAVQKSSVGGIMEALRSKAHTLMEIDRFFPSTQIHNICGNKKKIKLHERVYHCEFCDSKTDRDVNAALNILKEGKKLLTERKDIKLVELEIPFISNSDKFLTMKQEAQVL